MILKVDGGCHCGAIEFQAEIDPAVVLICHCSDCQNLSGAAYRATVSAPGASFVLLAGEPRRYVKTADSGRKRVHAFCGHCGSPIYSCADVGDPPTYSLRIGTLRQRHEFGPPVRQQWCASALAWSKNVEAVPCLERG